MIYEGKRYRLIMDTHDTVDAGIAVAIPEANWRSAVLFTEHLTPEEVAAKFEELATGIRTAMGAKT